MEINKKAYLVHRIVAAAFNLPRMEGQTVVDHINEDKGDNRKTNLRWVSPSENTSYSYASGSHSRAGNVMARNGDGSSLVGEDEQWKIVGNHGESISSCGRWKNRYGSIRLPHETDGSYSRVALNGKLEAVHRLVLTAFCPAEGSENLQVDHINGDRINNRLDNLRWATQSENIRASYAMSGPRGRNNSLSKGCRLKVKGDADWRHFDSFSEAERVLGFRFRSDGFYNKGEVSHGGLTYLVELVEHVQEEEYTEETWVEVTDDILLASSYFPGSCMLT
jgi:hypothetical protein